MTVMEIYGLIWFFVLAATGVSYLTGLINETTLPIFGLLFSTLAFTGITAVLPVWLNEHFSPKTYRVNFSKPGTKD